jgi:hypothetical protein
VDHDQPGRDPEQPLEEAMRGKPSEHERRVVEERDTERDTDQGSWPGEPGDPPGAARTDADR